MRKFARTMDEAFPFGPEYGCAITCAYKPSLAERLLFAAAKLAFIGTLLALALAYFDVLVP